MAVLFAGWQQTMIWSCVQGCMGAVYARQGGKPEAAKAVVGGFCFFAGKPDQELMEYKDAAYEIMVPQNKEWEAAIEGIYGNRVCRKSRFATKKQPGIWNRSVLESMAEKLPEGMVIEKIDRKLYDRVMALDWARDLAANFKSWHEYEQHGLGMVVLYQGEPVAGASSYTYYRQGIEIEIDTRVDQRRKGLARACGARLILECLDRGLYPSWDAHNRESIQLAGQLGYQFDCEYPIYEWARET